MDGVDLGMPVPLKTGARRSDVAGVESLPNVGAWGDGVGATRGRVARFVWPNVAKLKNPKQTHASVTLFIDKLRAQMVSGKVAVKTRCKFF